MKYFLLPVTLIGWALISYFALLAVYVGIMMIAQLSWIWIILGFSFLIGIVYLVGVGIPNLIKILILKLYSNRTTNILHAISGLLGIVLFGFILFSPSNIENFSAIWVDNKWKLIINFFPFLGLIVVSIISNLGFFSLETTEKSTSTNNSNHLFPANESNNNSFTETTPAKLYQDSDGSDINFDSQRDDSSNQITEEVNEDDIILPDDALDLINSLFLEYEATQSDNIVTDENVQPTTDIVRQKM